MGDDYSFHTEWRVAGTTAEVARVLSDARSLPVWWPSVYLAARILAPGAADGRGAVTELHTKGWLPYTLRWTLTVSEPVTEAGFAVTATGDLIGTGRWSFAQNGPEVEIGYDWQVSAAKPLLRRLTWLLRPAFSANHRWAMRRGEESLRLELRRRRAPTVQDAKRIPPPPGPTFRRRAV